MPEGPNLTSASRNQYNPGPAVSLNATWKPAADLEVLIIDGPEGDVDVPEQDRMIFCSVSS